jgi:hypothetical protein
MGGNADSRCFVVSETSNWIRRQKIQLFFKKFHFSCNKTGRFSTVYIEAHFFSKPYRQFIRRISSLGKLDSLSKRPQRKLNLEKKCEKCQKKCKMILFLFEPLYIIKVKSPCLIRQPCAENIKGINRQLHPWSFTHLMPLLFPVFSCFNNAIKLILEGYISCLRRRLNKAVRYFQTGSGFEYSF